MADQGSPHELIPGPQGALLQAAFGALTGQLLYVAAKLGIADHLQDSHRTGADLAPMLGVDGMTLQRVLRGLVSLGVCDEMDGGRFGLTPRGQYLRTDHPDSVQARVVLNGEVHYALWAHLLETVTTGESGSQQVFGMPFYEYLSSNPAVGALFDRALAHRSRHRAAVAAYDFGQFGTIVDVGGGSGALLVEILNTYPQPTGIVFDLPRIAAGAGQTIEAAGLSARCRFLGGDAFEAVPAGADAYILSNFLISWEDDQAIVPLRNCRQAMPPHGKLLLVEWVIPTGNEPKDQFRYWDTVTFDLIMLGVLGSGSGHVRTRAEFQALLSAAGFTITALVPTDSSVWVIEADAIAV
jgi:hypothetical protein